MQRVGLKIECVHCKEIFTICKSCYRGHKYCSDSCRGYGYKLRKTASRKKYDCSPEAQADHRDRQQEYRDRKKNLPSTNKIIKNVTDETSLPLASGIIVTSITKISKSIGCCICGQKLIFIRMKNESEFD